MTLGALATTLAEIGWDPEIRNIVALAFGGLVLFGSTILLVGSNTGPRSGLLIVVAALSSWMFIMGTIWWMYGIGMKGSPTHWRALEINRGDLTMAANEKVQHLPRIDEPSLIDQVLTSYPELEAEVNPAANPNKVIGLSELLDAKPELFEELDLQPGDLGGWHLLPPSNKQRGDAYAAAEALLVGTEPGALFSSPDQYRLVEVYDIGGKNNKWPLSPDAECKPLNPFSEGCRERVVNKLLKATSITHPEHLAVVQVQPVIPQAEVPGEVAPPAKLDEDAPRYSVVLVRSLGDTRFPAALITVSSLGALILSCVALHRRDKLIERNRAAAA